MSLALTPGGPGSRSSAFLGTFSAPWGRIRRLDLVGRRNTGSTAGDRHPGLTMRESTLNNPANVVGQRVVGLRL